TRIAAEGASVVDDKGVETFVPADSVILAAPRKPNHELFHEFEWMIDELHGAGDALIPRGLEQAIADGFRLGVRL
ncbi:MAG TPA: NADH oxidase, partial [Rhodocyclaceae bacterium]|nr:NADH oxidase [Rhodocyclaceae bacterium]